MEKRAKYAKLHPEMSNLDLTKILSKKYRELTERKKVSTIKLKRNVTKTVFPRTTIKEELRGVFKQMGNGVDTVTVY